MGYIATDNKYENYIFIPPLAKSWVFFYPARGGNGSKRQRDKNNGSDKYKLVRLTANRGALFFNDGKKTIRFTL